MILRKRNFPIHTLSKILNFQQFKVTNRILIDPRANSALGRQVEKSLAEKSDNKSIKVQINFKALKIRNTKDVEFLEIKSDGNMTINNLLRKSITMLYKRFDKKLQIEREID
jgi:hypothetical protein